MSLLVMGCPKDLATKLIVPASLARGKGKGGQRGKGDKGGKGGRRR